MTGKGSFNVSITPETEYVNPKCMITMHMNDQRSFLCKIQQFFNGMGSIYEHKNKTDWVVFRTDQLISIMSHFSTTSLDGLKLYNFNIWKEIVCLKKDKAHLTTEGLNKIKALKAKLNIWD
jgi:hypothetical protein